MNAQTLWNRYSQTWSMTAAERLARLAEVAAADVSYTDPNVTVTGYAAFSAYMDGFQENMPGASFRIAHVFEHHGRTLAHWTMHNGDGEEIGTGTSFAELGDDGRLKAITGFFNAG